MRLLQNYHAVRRVGLGLVDQALSSLTNFVLVVLVARSVEEQEFGAFALVLVTYQLVLVATRALVTDPLVVRFSGGDPQTRMQVTREATGAAAIAGLPIGIVVVAAGLMLTGTLGEALVVLGITLPGLLLQDAWRFAFGTAGQPGHAVTNDFVWGSLLLSIVAWLIVFHDPAVRDFVLVWGATGSFCALLGMFQTQMVPSFRNGIRWLRQNLDVSSVYVGESLVATGGLALALYVVSLIAGLSAVGALRGAQVLFGPITVLYLSMSLAAVPEAVRLHGRSHHQFVLAVHALAGVLASVTAGWGVLLTLVPRSIGTELLGATWNASRAVAPLLAIAIAADGIGTAYAIGLRVLGKAKQSLSARVAASPLTVVGAAVGAAAGGAKGAAFGLSIGYVTVAALVWLRFRKKKK